jgi:hypothetical protein
MIDLNNYVMLAERIRSIPSANSCDTEVSITRCEFLLTGRGPGLLIARGCIGAGCVCGSRDGDAFADSEAVNREFNFVC